MLGPPVGIGLVAFALFGLWLHGWLFGVSPFARTSAAAARLRDGLANPTSCRGSSASQTEF